MDLAKVLADLRAELDNLNSAIASFERLQERWSGRSSEWLDSFNSTYPPTVKRKLEPSSGATTRSRGV